MVSVETFQGPVRWRWLVAGVLGTSMVACGIYLLHGWQKGRIAERLLLEARAAVVSGAPEIARRRYSDHLALQPQGVEPYVEYAEVILGSDESQGARRFVSSLLQRAMMEGDVSDSVRLMFAENAVALGRYSEVLPELDLVRSENRTDSYFQLYGECLHECGAIEQAESAFREAIARNRQNAEAWVGLLQVTEEKYGYESALAASTAMSEFLPVDALLATGWIHLNKRMRSEAGEAFFAAARLDPSHDEAVASLARFLIHTNPAAGMRTNEMTRWALDHLSGVSLDSEYEKAMLLGDLAHRLNEYERAAKFYQTCLRYRAADEFALGRITEVLTTAGHTSDARRFLEQLPARPGTRLLKTILSARILKAEGQLSAAVELLADELQTPAHPMVRIKAHTVLIDFLIESNRFTDAVATSRMLMKESSDADGARDYLVRSLLLEGHLEEALQNTVRFDRPDSYLPELVPEIALAGRTADWEQSYRASLERLKDLYPGAPLFDLLEVAEMTEEGDARDAASALVELTKQHPSRDLYHTCREVWTASGYLPNL